MSIVNTIVTWEFWGWNLGRIKIKVFYEVMNALITVGLKMSSVSIILGMCESSKIYYVEEESECLIL